MITMKKRKVNWAKFETYPVCDCGGEYKSTGIIFTTMPAYYQYKCNKCGKLAELHCGEFKEVNNCEYVVTDCVNIP